MSTSSTFLTFFVSLAFKPGGFSSCCCSSLSSAASLSLLPLLLNSLLLIWLSLPSHLHHSPFLHPSRTLFVLLSLPRIILAFFSPIRVLLGSSLTLLLSRVHASTAPLWVLFSQLLLFLRLFAIFFNVRAPHSPLRLLLFFEVQRGLGGVSHLPPCHAPLVPTRSLDLCLSLPRLSPWSRPSCLDTHPWTRPF